MRPSELLLHRVIRPTLNGTAYGGRAAERLLLAIAIQESRCVHVYQRSGPARGFWQFEEVAIEDVYENPVSFECLERLMYREWARSRYSTAANARDLVFDALPFDAMLACAVARAYLWPDPAPLPEPKLEMEEEAWQYYLRRWKPGRPDRDRWSGSWTGALDV